MLVITIIIVLISLWGFYNPDLQEKLLFHPYSIKHNNQYYRWISSGFIHADIAHLAFNMIALYSFGENLIYIFNEFYPGKGMFLVICMFITGIPFASVFDFIKNKDNSSYAALGASGGVSSIIFASILFEPYNSIYIYFIEVPGIIFAVLYIAFSIYMSRKKIDNIGHNAHLFGALYGILFTIALIPDSISIFIYQIQQIPIGR